MKIIFKNEMKRGVLLVLHIITAKPSSRFSSKTGQKQGAKS
jgi:hypothetical protein